MLSPIVVPNCLSIGRCAKFSGNLIYHFAVTISFSKHRYWKICLDKTNEFKCDNILLIKLHQREIHNGRFRYGDVSQHDAMTSKNTGFAVCYPYPHAVHDDGRWHLSLISGHVYRRSNDSFDQNTSFKHIIMNVYIGYHAAIVVCWHYIL